jgi:hypothetical protein
VSSRVFCPHARSRSGSGPAQSVFDELIIYLFVSQIVDALPSIYLQLYVSLRFCSLRLPIFLYVLVVTRLLFSLSHSRSLSCSLFISLSFVDSCCIVLFLSGYFYLPLLSCIRIYVYICIYIYIYSSISHICLACGLRAGVGQQPPRSVGFRPLRKETMDLDVVEPYTRRSKIRTFENRGEGFDLLWCTLRHTHTHDCNGRFPAAWGNSQPYGFKVASSWGRRSASERQV